MAEKFCQSKRKRCTRPGLIRLSTQMSMLIVVVDLDCHKCCHKIRKILCQLQDHERIRTISFDNKSKTITIVGPFDPLRLACKLRCKGGKVVRDVHIVDVTTNGGDKPPPENMPDGPPMPAPAPVKKGKNKKKKKKKDKQLPAERPPSPPPETMMTPPPSSPVPHPPPPDQGMSAMVPQQHYVEEKPPRAELEPPMELPMPVPQHHHPPPPQMMPACPGRPLEQPVVEYVIPTLDIPSWPVPMVGPCCAPCYQGYYDSCRCSCCGRLYGTTVRPLPPPCGAYRGCRTFSDHDPSAACSIM